jgi:hypothetical protein
MAQHSMVAIAWLQASHGTFDDTVLLAQGVGGPPYQIPVDMSCDIHCDDVNVSPQAIDNRAECPPSRFHFTGRH